MMVPLQGIPAGPELLIIVLLFLIIIPLVLVYYVYTDAEGRGDDNAALWALAVGGLTVMTFFGGFVAMVVYIWQRE